MAELRAKERSSLPSSAFGLPGKRKYPLEDGAHAANAKARASQQVGKSISESEKEEIDAKANKVLAGKANHAATTNLASAKAKRK